MSQIGPLSRGRTIGEQSGPQDAIRALRRIGLYIDPVNRHRAEYLAGEIDVEEFERRVETALRTPPRDMGSVE